MLVDQVHTSVAPRGRGQIGHRHADAPDEQRDRRERRGRRSASAGAPVRGRSPAIMPINTAALIAARCRRVRGAQRMPDRPREISTIGRTQIQHRRNLHESLLQDARRRMATPSATECGADEPRKISRGPSRRTAPLSRSPKRRIPTPRMKQTSGRRKHRASQRVICRTQPASSR